MRTSELFSLPTNRATVSKLRAASDFFENASLYSSIIKGINDYLSLPKSIKSFTTKPTTQSLYDMIMFAKANGYRKEVQELKA